ncbi:hypothetical protein TNIN_72731 [Trichonephila inaurata madagascariensis]|uniref:C2H2-type domain-containing protein n=1 Tax=Trichonephila inaurata madagascariensis TaxID=2747483 RepID=A0A8X6WZL2_9ARAC|nr:hypothetical protein TNIN_72731 [Trichonephila inaurata madagascariensis]
MFKSVLFIGLRAAGLLLGEQWKTTGPLKVRPFPMDYAAKAKKNLFKCQRCPHVFYTAVRFEEHQLGDRLESPIGLHHIHDQAQEQSHESADPPRKRRRTKRRRKPHNPARQVVRESQPDDPCQPTRNRAVVLLTPPENPAQPVDTLRSPATMEVSTKQAVPQGPPFLDMAELPDIPDMHTRKVVRSPTPTTYY